jgi:type VII secretion protein EccE
VHVVQIMWWQALAAAVIVTIGRDARIVSSVAAVAALLAMPSVVLVRRQWLYRWLAVWLRYRLRGRTLSAAPTDTRLSFLEFIEPSTVVTSVEIDEEPAAVLAHTGGVTAVLELWPADGALLVGPAQPLPSVATLLPVDDGVAPPTNLQLLVQVLPAPSPQAGTGIVAESYRELTGGAVPAQRRAWLALQVRRTPDGYDNAELLPALSLAVRRLRRRLRQDHVANRLLDREDLLAAAALLGGIDAGRPGTYGTARGRPLAREGWRAVLTSTTLQSAYRLSRWPGATWSIDQLACGVPATATTFAVAVTRDAARTGQPDDLAVELVLRVLAADMRQLSAAEHDLTRAAQECGGLLERLDGEQRAGIAATLPFGGFLP